MQFLKIAKFSVGVITPATPQNKNDILRKPVNQKKIFHDFGFIGMSEILGNLTSITLLKASAFFRWEKSKPIILSTRVLQLMNEWVLKAKSVP